MKKTVYFIILFLLIAFCSIFVLFSAMMLRSSYKDLRNKNHQYYWLKKSAVIKDFSKFKNGYKQRITYNYKVNDQIIIGKDSLKFDSRIEKNKTIFIWYNPHKLNESTVIRKVNIFNNIIFAFTFSTLPLFLIIGSITSLTNENTIINKIKILKQ